jgi:hypothetical protein
VAAPSPLFDGRVAQPPVLELPGGRFFAVFEGAEAFSFFHLGASSQEQGRLLLGDH